MDFSPIDISIRELTFYLFRRPLHPELFTLYSSRQFVQGEYEVHIWITGCSHLVSVFSGKHCMTELICPPAQMLPTRGLVEQFPFRGEKTHRCEWSNGLRYMTSFQVEVMSQNLYEHTHQDLCNMKKRQGIFVSYPQWDRGDLITFSYVDYEAQKTEFRIHTYHAFPEQQTILKTQSLFDLRKK